MSNQPVQNPKNDPQKQRQQPTPTTADRQKSAEYSVDKKPGNVDNKLPKKS